MFHPAALALPPVLRRPRLLVRAARAGLADYRRTRDLPRLLHRLDVPEPARALRALARREEELEAQRKAAAPGYSAAAHVAVLIALMAEQQALAETREPVPAAAIT